MTRRDRIELLLTHYRAVLEGLPGVKERDDDDILALMCEEWNHPSYQRLEYLLEIMHQRWPRLRQAIRVRYERYSEVRVAYCRVCRGTESAGRIGEPHLRARVAGAKLLCRVGSTAPDMVPRVVRVPDGVDGRLVSAAIDWLDERWNGEAELPTAVLGYGTHERLQAA